MVRIFPHGFICQIYLWTSAVFANEKGVQKPWQAFKESGGKGVEDEINKLHQPQKMINCGLLNKFSTATLHEFHLKRINSEILQ